jgi:hypothetical protein
VGQQRWRERGEGKGHEARDGAGEAERPEKNQQADAEAEKQVQGAGAKQEGPVVVAALEKELVTHHVEVGRAPMHVVGQRRRLRAGQPGGQTVQALR